MRGSLPSLFTILLLIALSICSACVSQPPANQTPAQNNGPVQVTPAESLYISFAEAKEKLAEYKSNSAYRRVTAYSLNYMRSRDVDSSGDATGWIFGINSGNTSEFLVYDRTGWTTIANASLPSEEIVLETILSPDLLFKKNRELITGNLSPVIPERRELELQQGIYTFTGTSGSTTRILTFNATTGALIS
jgi:hypothetical protein